ncbi:hypothetical protein HZY62_21360 [Maribacter polysiphoniae]|uniref:Uncharacterized protein n=1 Tax=Maribacter polysiphoniae TaxID=429344 RepID=A0A316DM87_9FLAO|nr:hypothetical protein [Maribacter polysiphoniae]MBD1263152.1 hypothetical protein [Maribacter polysiphoniae]PWK18349.1 hypothetical protein LX92_04360 [Maribacter polysiphoniae]
MNAPKAEKKHVFLRSYDEISNLEKTIEVIQKSKIKNIMISILGNLEKVQPQNSKRPTDRKVCLENYFKNLLGLDTDLGFFHNAESGELFVTGFLAPIFLDKINEKTLGALSGGPYGVLRGLGIRKKRAGTYIDLLNDGEYLMLVRGNYFDIHLLEGILDKLEPIDQSKKSILNVSFKLLDKRNFGH